MRKRLNILLVLAVLNIAGQAQSIFRVSDMEIQPDGKGVKVGFRSEGFTNSSALTGRASNAGFFGGYITEADRQFMLDRAGNSSNAGQFLNNSIFATFRIDTLFGKVRSGLTFFGNVSDRQESNAMFNKEALALVLFGNKQFAGKSESFGPIAFNNYRYNQIQIGMHKTFVSDVKLGVGVSFLYGQYNQTASSETLDVLTSDDGTQISGVTDFEMVQTNPDGFGSSYRGAGASMDIAVDFPVKLLKKQEERSRLRIMLMDAGFIQWHSNSVTRTINDSFLYEGIDVANIFKTGLTSITPQDYLDSIMVSDTGSYTSIVPFTGQLELFQRFLNSEISLGALYRNRANYTVFVYAKYMLNLGDSWQVGGQFNYGGYGKLGGGLEMKYSGNTFEFKLGSTNIEGFLNPTKWAGQSIYGSIAIRI